MFEFEENKNYTFGILTQNFDHTTESSPKWERSSVYKPYVVSGKVLIENGITNFDEYLRSEYCPFPPHKIVACYTEDVDKKGNFITWRYLGRGNPIKKNKENLSDNGQQLPMNITVSGTGNTKSEKELFKMYQQQIEMLSNQLLTLNNELNDARKALVESEIELRQQIATLEADKHKLEIENETLKGMFEKYNENNNTTTLSDGVNNFLSNPAIAPVLSVVLTKIMDKLFPNQPLPQQQTQPINNVANNENQTNQFAQNGIMEGLNYGNM